MELFKEIFNLTYSEARERYPEFETKSKTRKAITMKNGVNIDSVSNNSDILVYYDMLQDSAPLLLVERIPKSEAGWWKMRKVVKYINDDIDGYKASMQKSSDKKYVDLIVIKENIVSAIEEGIC